jgi:hypothetical protein
MAKLKQALKDAGLVLAFDQVSDIVSKCTESCSFGCTIACTQGDQSGCDYWGHHIILD